MSILINANNYYLLDHCDYTSNLYQNVPIDENYIESYEFSKKLFSIKTNRQDVSRKRTRGSDDVHKEAKAIETMYWNFMKEVSPALKCTLNNKYDKLDTSNVRDLSKRLFQSNIFNHAGIRGENNSEVPLKCKVKDEYFLIPQQCKFYSGCVKEQCEKLYGNKYDIVLADPPWWNKYIRRLKSANDKLSYSMMYNEDIASIPVKDLLLKNCLVAIWCTNAPSNVAAIKNIIFPKWGVEYITTWYWLKVTIDLEPICSFGVGSQKQPYERLMLGKVGEVKDVPDSLLIVSVPSALHSHKPPVLDLLTPYINAEQPQTLELFARYLLPNTTSVGYEPLKWQHISLYDNVT